MTLSQGVFAQQPPTGGSQLQQIQPVPQQPKAAPDLRIEQGNLPAVASAGGKKILIRVVRISGSTAFSRGELLGTIQFKPDSELTLDELRAMAAKVTDLYRSKGYFVAQTFLPPQDIKDGAVEFAVIEGQYGQITLRNQSKVQDSTAKSLLAGLNVGDTVAVAPLEHRLMLLSDLPGVTVKSTLVPGASVGASDLIIDLSPGQRVTGSIDADNHGNRYTGAGRVGASLTVNEPTGLGDVATVRVLAGTGLTYGRAAYQVQLGEAKAGLAYTSLAYELGQEFASAQLKGTAQIASLFGSYPLIRSRNNNLYAQLAYDSKTFSDRQGLTAPAIVADKRARVVMSSLNGDYRDALGGGGLNTYTLTWTRGNIYLLSATALSADAAGPQSNGHFDKLTYSFARLQSINSTTALYASLNGQVASKNLDASEKMSLGGASAVRAYPAGEATGDEGYVLTLEARKQISFLGQPLQLIGFVDAGAATLSKNPWSAVGTPNSRNLSGAGLGFNWSSSNDLAVKAYYALKLRSGPAISAPDTTGRFWLQAVKYF